jgi:hypothetical protein
MTFIRDAGFSRKGNVNMDVLKKVLIGAEDGCVAAGLVPVCITP